MRIAIVVLTLLVAGCTDRDDGPIPFTDPCIADDVPAPQLPGIPPALGRYAIHWTCEENCQLAPNLPTQDDMIDISAGQLAWWWSVSLVIDIRTPATQFGACWRIDSSEVNCQHPFYVCSTPNGVQATDVRWYVPGARTNERWVMSGHRVSD